MPIDTFVAFLAATIVLMLIPGPSVMLAVGVSLAHGFRTGMANVVGASGAVAVQMVVLGIGLTPVLLFAAQWFNAIRWAGVFYLLYLGLVQWRRAGAPPPAIGVRSHRHRAGPASRGSCARRYRPARLHRHRLALPPPDLPPRHHHPPC